MIRKGKRVRSTGKVEVDLNELCARKTSNLSDRGTQEFHNVSLKVYFRDLPAHIIEHIRGSRAVFGCIAWLTCKDIIDALSTVHCSIIVQKEDFLRPDLNSNRRQGYSKWLRARYDNLRCGVKLREFPPSILKHLSNDMEASLSSVRCAGIKSQKDIAPLPKCHHKFLVFCDYKGERYKQRQGNWEEVIPGKVTPVSVWTGSFNCTENSRKSLENAIVIYDTNVAGAYLEEFARIYALSEQLDWKTRWASPEFKL